MLQYFEKYPSPFDKIYFEDSKNVPTKKRKTLSQFEVTDQQLVQCCYIFLTTNADFFRSKWSWSVFIKNYLNHSDCMIKWLCCHCIAIVTGMHETQLQSLLEINLPQDKIIECTIKHSSETGYLNINVNKSLPSDTSPLLDITSSPNVFNNVISVAGILIPVYKESSNVTHLVQVKSAQCNLRKVALGIAANRAVCLQGPVGSSKTALVEYLAALTGRTLGESFIKVQLGDQTDSKMLLGTYRCTDIPGEFVWQPGVLTQVS